MILKIIILLVIIFISSTLNILILRYSIKKKIINFDFKSNNKYPITVKEIYILINIVSLNIWIIPDMTSNEWDKYKKKLPLFYIGTKYHTNTKNIVFLNSPNSTKIIKKNIINKECILISQILSFKYDFDKKYIKFIIYLSNRLNINNNIKSNKNENYIQFLSKKKVNSSNDKILINTTNEFAEIIYDLDDTNLYINNNNYEDKKYINEEIDKSIPLYSYWKTLLVIIILVTSYICNIVI